MIKLGIKNFQSILEGKLEFYPGVSLILGASSSGKSAIFRAVKSLVINPQYSKRYITTGQDSMAVALQLSGHKPVFWVRDGGGVKYRVGEQMFVKLGRNDIYSVYGEFPLRCLPDGRFVHMHGEWDKLFPFENTSSEMFKLFEDVFQIEDSSKVIGLMKDDELGYKKKIEETRVKVEQNKERVKKLEEFLSKYDINQIDKKVMEVKTIIASLERLSKDYEMVEKEVKYLVADVIKESNLDFGVVDKYKDLSKDVIELDSQIKLVGVSLAVQEFEGFFNLGRIYSDVINDEIKLAQLVKELTELECENNDMAGEMRCAQVKLNEFDACPLCERSFKGGENATGAC